MISSHACDANDGEVAASQGRCEYGERDMERKKRKGKYWRRRKKKGKMGASNWKKKRKEATGRRNGEKE